MVNFKKKALQIGILALLLCIPLSGFSQGNIDKLSQKVKTLLAGKKAEKAVAAFVYFTDKGDNIESKLLEAEAALSPRSLQRRMINRGADNLVDFTDIPLNGEYVDLVASEVVKVRHQLKALNAVSVDATPRALARIAKFDFVEKITVVKKVRRNPEPATSGGSSTDEPDGSMLLLDTTESESMAAAQSVASIDYGSSYTQNNQINVPAVHDLGYNGNGVIIAIFDAGFNRLTHEAFNQMDIAATRDFVNGGTDVGDGGGMGEGSHGTNTLSTVGGYSPGDLIGPAYGATYYLAKTENTESELHVEEDNWCAAADWADTNGAQIITSSLSYKDFDTGTDYTAGDMDGDTTVITQCADLTATKGIVVINSAGNAGSGSGENTLGAPSDGHFVLAVGAVTSTGSRSSFSSVGPTADGRIKPDVMAMGSSVRVASSTSDTGYSSVNGTSFSCPLTAGVAALVLEAAPATTASELRDILRNTADNSSSPDNLYGYGIINALTAVEAATADTLIANFTTTNNLLEVTFNDSSNVPSGATITSWSWTFGDSGTSTVQNPVHTYAAAGSYSVTLTVNDSLGGNDSITKTVDVTDTLVYCTSQGNDYSYEWISQVDVGSFSNSSGAQSYSDFTSQVINVTTGQNYATTLSPGFSSSTYTEYWKVWIDFNRDGDFTDSGEEVFSDSGRSDVSGSISIPSSAPTGNTRMRVTMKYNGTPTSCETFTYGEVEDYTVSIGN